MNEEIKENVVIEDFDFSMIADFFKRVDRQGPGGERETRLAASLIPSFQRSRHRWMRCLSPRHHTT